jgi:hypothetical protein
MTGSAAVSKDAGAGAHGSRRALRALLTMRFSYWRHALRYKYRAIDLNARMAARLAVSEPGRLSWAEM